MSESAARSPRTAADAPAPEPDGTDRPHDDSRPIQWWRLGDRARRAGVAGCAALLLGATALTSSGTAVPSPVKLPIGAYVEAELRLEADPAPPEEFGLGEGVTLVSATAATVKSAHRDPFDDSPVCVSHPLAPGSYRVSSPYGYRTHPIFGTYTMHMGNDYAAPLGTPIHALTDGTVVYTGPGRLGRSSELLIIEHTVEDTTFYSWYVHMYPEGIFVEVGQRVRAGEVVAEVGNNGNSTGPHLHFEIHTADPGLGLQKNPVGRRTAAFSVSATPSADPTEEFGLGPTDEPGERSTDEPSEGATEEPSDEPTDEPSDGATNEPTDEPSDGATAEPTDEPSNGATDEPTDEPSDGATDEPTDEPTGEPTDEPTETPTEEPTTEEPTEEPSPEPTEEPTTEEPAEEPSEEPAEEDEEERRTRTPFPTRAYGTTVDPVPFLASLGLTMVAPDQCTAS